jgi:hypothetical protein
MHILYKNKKQTTKMNNIKTTISNPLSSPNKTNFFLKLSDRLYSNKKKETNRKLQFDITGNIQ